MPPKPLQPRGNNNTGKQRPSKPTAAPRAPKRILPPGLSAPPPQRPYNRRQDAPPPRGKNPPGPLGHGVHILYEDPDLIVIDKPPGLISAVPAALNASADESLTDRLRLYFQRTGVKRKPRSDAPLPGIIHRLDREASGLIVFTKTARAYSWLKDDFKHKRVHRLYTALVQGTLGKPGDTGTIQSFLKPGRTGKVVSIPTDAYRGPVLAAANTDDEDVARLAVTHYRVLGSANNRTLVQVRLASGRKHQIRVHFSSRGNPLVGDRLYNASDNALNRLALHASELGFTHPGSAQPQRYTSPPPPAFYRLVNMEPPAHKPAEPPTAPPKHIETPKSKHDPAPDTSWNQVAAWYDDLIDERKSDHYTGVIVPGTMRLVMPTPGQRILDVACGQGVIARALASLGARVTGVDAAPDLIAAAKARAARDGGEFLVGDARNLASLNLPGNFDAATCVMALTNIEPIEPVLTGIAEQLRPGGALVLVISHPCFRAPGQTSWGFDNAKGMQFRRVDGYLSTGQHRIQMHPGDAPDIVTWTFHRPLQAYIRALSQADLVVEGLEEWASRRQSQPGPRAESENRARREIPLFLAIRATRR
ncbi:MAG: pseudouridine synthase [bacterium]